MPKPFQQSNSPSTTWNNDLDSALVGDAVFFQVAREPTRVGEEGNGG